MRKSAMVTGLAVGCFWLFMLPVWAPEDGRESTEGDERRVLRGGSWNDYRTGVRAASRYGNYPDSGSSRVGLRVVRVGSPGS